MRTATTFRVYSHKNCFINNINFHHINQIHVNQIHVTKNFFIQCHRWGLIQISPL